MPDKFIEIDDPGDAPDLFKAICDNVLKMHPLAAKRLFLGRSGGDKTVAEYMPTAHDIITMCSKAKVNLKLNMRVEYHDDTFDKEPEKRLPDPPPPPSENHTLMEEQKKVVNADLRVVKDDDSTIRQQVPPPAAAKVDASQIPDF